MSNIDDAFGYLSPWARRDTSTRRHPAGHHKEWQDKADAAMAASMLRRMATRHDRLARQPHRAICSCERCAAS